MAASYKPEGYSTVSPYLIAAGAQAVIDFLKKAFGARELRRYDMPDGSIMHAEVRIGDTVVISAKGAGPGSSGRREGPCGQYVVDRDTGGVMIRCYVKVAT